MDWLRARMTDLELFAGALIAFVAVLALGPKLWNRMQMLSAKIQVWRAVRRERSSRLEAILSLTAFAKAVEELPRVLQSMADQLRTKDGHSLVEVLEGMANMVKVVAEGLEHVNARMDVALSMSDQASATANDHGDFVSVTRSLVKQSGRSPVELDGRNWFAAIHEEDRKTVKVMWEEAVADKHEFEAYFSWKRHDGTAVPVKMVAWYVPSLKQFVVSSKLRNVQAEIATHAKQRGMRNEEVNPPPP